MEWDDESDDREDDFEGPSAEDRRRFGGDTTPCPACGREIHDEAVSCPHCGHWVEDAPTAGGGLASPRLVIGVLLAVAIAGGGGLLWWLSRTLI